MHKTLPPKKVDDTLIEVPPHAGRTLAALRELGYGSVAAISDLIDNSINAGAKHVSVTVRSIGQTEAQRSHIVEIADDGHGMDREKLIEALRLGSDSEYDQKKSLGKFGMGLKTASLSFARTIQVLTRVKGGAGYEATFDLGMIERSGKFQIRVTPASSKRVLDTIGDFGTFVSLTNIDRLDDTNSTRFAATLRLSLGQTFRNFIADGLVLKVNGRKVEAVDPLMRKHPLTQVRFDGVVELGQGKRAHLTVVELPDLGPIEEEQGGIVPDKSGYYIVRNRREIMDAQTFGMYKHHHSYSHFRAELSFTGELDTDFHVDVMKSSIMPNDQMLDRIRHVADKFRVLSGEQGRERAVVKTRLVHSRPTPTDGPDSKPPYDFTESDHGRPGPLFKVEQKDGQTIINYNKRNPLVQAVADARSRKVTDVVDRLCLAIARMHNGNVDHFNETLHTILSAGTSEDTWEVMDKKPKKQ